jgi:Mn-containing catalase
MLQELLVSELQDLLHAEGQLLKALPKMAKAAHDPKLKTAFEAHLKETEGQVERLNQAFGLLDAKIEAKSCKAMQGLVAEGEETIAEGKEKSNDIADLALIVAAQKVEHYEMSGYGSARAIAEQIGGAKVAKLLSQTETEEEKADKLLTEIAKRLMEHAGQRGEQGAHATTATR